MDMMEFTLHADDLQQETTALDDITPDPFLTFDTARPDGLSEETAVTSDSFHN